MLYPAEGFLFGGSTIAPSGAMGRLPSIFMNRSSLPAILPKGTSQDVPFFFVVEIFVTH